jgi:hypothetical protein
MRFHPRARHAAIKAHYRVGRSPSAQVTTHPCTSPRRRRQHLHSQLYVQLSLHPVLTTPVITGRVVLFPAFVLVKTLNVSADLDTTRVVAPGRTHEGAPGVSFAGG